MNAKANFGRTFFFLSRPTVFFRVSAFGALGAGQAERLQLSVRENCKTPTDLYSCLLI